MKIAIKPEAPEDYEAVEKILLAALHTEAESKVMKTLREKGNALISLVAISDDKVVGLILFSTAATHLPRRRELALRRQVSFVGL